MVVVANVVLVCLQTNCAANRTPMQDPGATVSLLNMVEVANKRSALVKQELLTRIDLFGKQLHLRLLAAILSYVEPSDLARSQAVCSGWRLSSSLLNRSWQLQYSRHWESGSGELKELAVGGAETPWVERYKRRGQTEANWQRGQFRQSQHTLPTDVRCSLQVGECLVALGSWDGELMLFDTNSKTVVKTLAEPAASSMAHSG